VLHSKDCQEGSRRPPLRLFALAAPVCGPPCRRGFIRAGRGAP